MNPARLITGLTRQVLAAWTVVLSLLLVWSVGATAPQTGSGPSVRSEAISLSGSPELAAVQVTSGAALRATDDRHSAGPDPFVPETRTAPASAATPTQGLTAPDAGLRITRAHGPHSPRAPPAA
ncbi:MAG: hypothetical protein B7X55_02435 [Rhodobacterales bacterium 34-62-10]|nr:MAG: hypothetical protein B7X55_02435 [Rhodobacterales bacterium 34-62-10]